MDDNSSVKPRKVAVSYGQESDIDSRIESVSFSLPELTKLDEADTHPLEESSISKSSRPSISNAFRSSEEGGNPEEKQHRASDASAMPLTLEYKQRALLLLMRNIWAILFFGSLARCNIVSLVHTILFILDFMIMSPDHEKFRKWIYGGVASTSFASTLFKIVMIATKSDFDQLLGYRQISSIFSMLYDIPLFLAGIALFAIKAVYFKGPALTAAYWSNFFLGRPLKNWKHLTLKRLSFAFDYLIVINMALVGVVNIKLLNGVFFLLSLADILLWGHLSPSFFKWIRRFLVLFLILHCILYELAQFVPIFSREVSVLLGLERDFLCRLFSILLLINTLSGTLLRFYLSSLAKSPQSQLFSMDPISLHSAKHIMYKIKSNSIFSFLLKNLSLVFVFIYALWALLYAYILSLPLFLWSVACLLFNIHWDSKPQNIVRYYCGLLLCSEYALFIFNIPVFWQIDASLPSGVSIALRLYLLGFLRILKYFKGVDDLDALSKRSFSLAPETKEDPDEPGELSKWKKSRMILFFILKNIKNFCLRIFFIISIGGIFFCSLQQVTLLNATYHAYFLIFLIFPRFARKAWKSLIAYTAAVISMQLIWSIVSFRQLFDPFLSKQIGLSSLNGFHVIIYVMSSIQLKAYDISNDDSPIEAENSKQISDETDLEAIRELKRIFRTCLEFLLYAVHHFWIVFTCFFLTLPFLKSSKVTLIDTGYLILAFIYFILSGFNLPQFKLILWLISIGYTGLTIILFYVYQFPWVSGILQKLTAPYTADYGLFVANTQYLFLHQTLTTAILLTIIWQLHLFRVKATDVPVFPTSLAKSIPNWIKRFSETIKRLLIMHLPKLVALLFCFTATSDYNLLNLIILGVGLLLLIFSFPPKALRYVLLCFIEIVILANIFYQFHFFSRINYPVDPRLFGIYSIPKHPVTKAPLLAPVVFLRYEVSVLALLVLLNIVAFWRKSKDAKVHEPETAAVVADEFSLMRSNSNRDKSTSVSKASLLFSSFVYYSSHFFLEFGSEMLLLILLVVFFIKPNFYGMFYGFILFLSILPIPKPNFAWIILILLILGFILAQYSFQMISEFSSALNYRNIAVWLQKLPPLTKSIFCLDPSESNRSILFADFVLLMAVMRERIAVSLRKIKPRRFIRILPNLRFNCNLDEADFLTKTKFSFYSKFYWTIIILPFFIGIGETNLSRLIFLSFAFFFLFRGEEILTHSRGKVYLYLFSLYMFLFMYAQMFYQFFLDVSIFKEDYIANNIIGLHRLSFSPDSTNKAFYYFDSFYVLIIFSFFLTAIHLKMSKSEFMNWVVIVLKADYLIAKKRAISYYEGLVVLVRKYYKNNLDNARRIQAKIVELQQTNPINIDDWVLLFGCKTKNFRSKNLPVLVQEDQGSLSDAPSIEAQDIDAEGSSAEVRSHVSEAKQMNYEAALYQNISKEGQEYLVADEDFIEGIEAVDDEPWLVAESKKGRLNAILDWLVINLYKFSETYRKLRFNDYVDYSAFIKLNSNLSKTYKLRLIATSVWYIFISELALLVYLFLFINFAHQSCVIGAIPILCLFSFGISQRPHTSKKFWRFLIVYNGLWVLVLFLYHGFIGVPSYSKEIGIEWPEIIGLHCGRKSYFTCILLKFLLLVSLTLKRESMQTMGLWDYFDAYVEKLKDQGDQEYKENLERTRNIRNSSKTSFQKTSTPTPSDSGEGGVIEAADDAFESDSEETDGGGDEFALALQAPEKSRRTFRQRIQDIRYYFACKYQSYTTVTSLPGKDFYLATFLLDALSFLLMMICWADVSGNSGSTQTFYANMIKTNTVPPLFVAICLLNFFLLIFDRIAYSSKSLKGKILLQLTSVISFHIWILFALPLFNQYFLDSKIGLQIWYFFKCLYWLVSSYQIKYGFPLFRSSFFLTKRYSLLNNYVLMVVHFIPFIFEMRAIIDWSISHSPLSLYQWLKFEDIFFNMFSIQCTRESEKVYPRKFGEAFSRGKKIVVCIILLLLLAFLIWLPLIVVSVPISLAKGELHEVNLSFRINQFPAFMEFSAYTAGKDIKPATARDSKVASLLLGQNIERDLLEVVTVPENAKGIWNISPLDRKKMTDLLNSTNEANLYIDWVVHRSGPQMIQSVNGRRTNELKFGNAGRLRENLVDLFTSTSNTKEVTLDKIGAMVLILPADGSMVIKFEKSLKVTKYESSSSGANSQAWFQMGEASAPYYFYVYSEKVSQNYFGSFGILGLYVTVFFTIGRFVRMTVSGLLYKIPFEDLPSADYVLEMCEDLLVVREFNDLVMEETLYWQIITLFRQPNLLIERTRLRRD